MSEDQLAWPLPSLVFWRTHPIERRKACSGKMFRTPNYPHRMDTPDLHLDHSLGEKFIHVEVWKCGSESVDWEAGLLRYKYKTVR